MIAKNSNIKEAVIDVPRKSLLSWAKEVLLEAEKKGMSSSLKSLLYNIAIDVIEDGGLRGDVSEAWLKRPEVRITDIPDLYL